MAFDLEQLRRNSRIHMDADGVFYHEGERIANERIQRLFLRGVRVSAEGEVTLHVGSQWCYIECHGCPFFVVGARVLGEESAPTGFELRLSDDSYEPLRPETLAFGEDRLYARVKSGLACATFRRTAYHQIAGHLVDGSPQGEGYALRLASGDFVLARMDTTLGA